MTADHARKASAFLNLLLTLSLSYGCNSAPSHSSSCNGIRRLTSRIVMIFTTLMLSEIAEIFSLYNGKFLALNWNGVKDFAWISL